MKNSMSLTMVGVALAVVWARAAEPGEFTLRAFLSGRIDLSQAEAVADLIASSSAASHKVAMNQMRGGFSSELARLREQLLNFISLIELELDFSEEDVEFADRGQLTSLVAEIASLISSLVESFRLGNVLKKGVPVAIIGRPNVGKSTLFNRLVGKRKSVVHEMPGTTRDRIQDETEWNGVAFTVVDTGGIEVYQPKGSRDDLTYAEGSIDFVSEIRAQALLAVQDAEVIVMLVDAIQGVTAADEQVA